MMSKMEGMEEKPILDYAADAPSEMRWWLEGLFLHRIHDHVSDHSLR